MLPSSVIQESVCSNGCFVLGKEGPSFNRYTTRYRLERRKLSNKSETTGWSIPCPAVLRDAWCGPGDSDIRQDTMWRHEVSLGALHVLVLVFGALDACLDLRFKVHAHAHLILCTIATLLATLQMAGKITSLKTPRHELLAFEMLATQDDNDAGMRCTIVLGFVH